MSLTASQLLDAALELPEAERRELIQALIVSVDHFEQGPFDESRWEVIRRRSADIASGKVTLIPWTEVKRRARDSAGG